MPDFRPGKPRLRAAPTAAFAAATGTQAITPMVASIDDVGGWSTGTYTVDRDGLYLIMGSVAKSTTTAATRATAGWSRNGTPQLQAGAAATSAAVTFTFADLAELNAGDTVQLITTISGGTSANLGPVNTFIALVRVGPVRWT